MPSGCRTGKPGLRCQTGGVTDRAPTPDPTPARRGRPGYDSQQILAAAVDLFITHGYDATSVAAVAERLGLTKSALYHHYESKEHLLSVALDEALGGLEGVLDEQGARAGAAGARLE